LGAFDAYSVVIDHFLGEREEGEGREDTAKPPESIEY
jgi:hypothetical protein